MQPRKACPEESVTTPTPAPGPPHRSLQLPPPAISLPCGLTWSSGPLLTTPAPLAWFSASRKCSSNPHGCPGSSQGGGGGTLPRLCSLRHKCCPGQQPQNSAWALSILPPGGQDWEWRRGPSFKSFVARRGVNLGPGCDKRWSGSLKTPALKQLGSFVHLRNPPWAERVF